MNLFLGIDGGQSSTTALVGDESGRVLGAGRGGPCNHVKGPEGRTKFIDAIGGCVRDACTQAGVDGPFESVAAGFSGGPADKESLLRELVPAAHVRVTDDAVIALAGATGGQPGIIVVAGTGSIAYGRNAAGRTVRAGGWGYIFGDEGGAFDLTRQALRAALRYEEGWGPSTALHRILLQETGAATANELMHRFYTTDYPRPRVAAYSKLVDEAAQAGDTVARDILKSAAQQLASLAGAVRGQLFHPGEDVLIAWIGGVFNSSLLREQFRLLLELEDGTRTAPPKYSPAAGALLEAYRAVGLYIELTNLPEHEK
jgi:N-acetylglucosamine kinase-like BadF-type ATPase